MLGCSEKDIVYPKAGVVVQAVNPYLYYPGVETPFSQVEISLSNQLGIPARLNRISISYSDQYNREKLVMAKSISYAYDLFLAPQQVTILQLNPIEYDFFDQLALLDPPTVIYATGKDSLTDSQERTAQEFPVLGKISMEIHDANGNQFSIDAYVLIHYLGDIPDSQAGTGTGTGTGTDTGTDTEVPEAMLKIENPKNKSTFKYREGIDFVGTASVDITSFSWKSSRDGEFSKRVTARGYAQLSIGTHNITLSGVSKVTRKPISDSISVTIIR